MSAMSYKSNSKLNLPIVISIVLHVLLIVILGYNAVQYSDENLGTINGQSVDAIMVDPAVMTEQYQRNVQNQLSQQKAAKQAQELQEKQLAEQQRLKELEKERIKATEQQKQEAAATAAAQAAKKQAEEDARKAKMELEEQQKESLLAKQKAEQEAAKAKQEAEKQKQAADKAAADKAAADKAAADKAAKQKAAAAAKNNQAVDDILGGLTSGSPSSSFGAPATRKGVSDGELAKYKSLVTNAISNKFINPNKLYSGRNCVLRIQIAPDGLLLSVEAQGGDDALCREAVSATKLAVIPKPASGLYQEVKTMIIDFQPK